MSTSKGFRKALSRFAELEDSDKEWVIDDLKKGLYVSKDVIFPIADRSVSKDLTIRIADALSSSLKESTKPTVFLSYSSKDKKFVRALAHRLRKSGIVVWVDEGEILIGESLISKLQHALEAVDFLVVILSQNSIDSPWVQKEVEIAMNHEIKSKRVKVLPILKDSVALPWFLEGKFYSDFRTKQIRSKATDKLIRDILTYHADRREL
jgi:hypothetical protein